ncbi:hypothetical protein [Piscinibacter terrae]|nr:hypothetical protein [Albitalea terrae]
MTQGILMSRELRITCTVLANGNPAKLTARGLETMKAARRISGTKAN